MKQKLIKLDPQPPKNVTSETHYCDPYNQNKEKYTFWAKDNRMCLCEGNIPNTAHWKPPSQDGLIGVVYKQGAWFWEYEDSINELEIKEQR